MVDPEVEAHGLLVGWFRGGVCLVGGRLVVWGLY